MRIGVMCKWLSTAWVLIPFLASESVIGDDDVRISVDNDGWELIGDLRLPDSPQAVPAVLLLNRAAGNRMVYEELATQLERRGIASLRLDLRGHGESTNLGRFIPAEADERTRELMIWEANADVVAAHRFLKSHQRIDAEQTAMVGASYSGEEMAEAARKNGYAKAYVALSPGSFSEQSIRAMDESSVPWLFVVSREERFLHKIAATVQDTTRTVEILYVPGSEHATRILEKRPDISERIAVWLAAQLQTD